MSVVRYCLARFIYPRLHATLRPFVLFQSILNMDRRWEVFCSSWPWRFRNVTESDAVIGSNWLFYDSYRQILLSFFLCVLGLQDLSWYFIPSLLTSILYPILLLLLYNRLEKTSETCLSVSLSRFNCFFVWFVGFLLPGRGVSPNYASTANSSYFCHSVYV